MNRDLVFQDRNFIQLIIFKKFTYTCIYVILEPLILKKHAEV